MIDVHSMKTFKKKLRSHVKVARANLDRAILDLKSSRLKPLKSKLEKSGSKVGSDSDLAWAIAARVLQKVRGIRKSLSTSKATIRVNRSPKKKSTRRSQSARA